MFSQDKSLFITFIGLFLKDTKDYNNLSINISIIVIYRINNAYIQCPFIFYVLKVFFLINLVPLNQEWFFKEKIFVYIIFDANLILNVDN